MKHRDSVLITGSAGIIGRKLSRQLAEQGRSVIAVFHKHLPEQRTDVIPIQSDFSDFSPLVAALKSVSTVVHLAWDRSREDEQANVRIIDGLLRAMESAGTRRIVFPSFHGADRHANSRLLREKFFCEQRVLHSHVKEKSIIRAHPLVDPQTHDHGFTEAVRTVLKTFPLVYPIPQSKAQMHFSFLSELIERLSFCVDRRPMRDEEVYFEELKPALEQTMGHFFRQTADQAGLKKLAIPGLIGRWIYSISKPVALRAEEKKGEFSWMRTLDDLVLSSQARLKSPASRAALG